VLKEVLKMPRLSEKTLEKRFQCSYCGKTFRYRQGLSGHIQFKHQGYFEPSDKAGQLSSVTEKGFILSKHKDFLKWRVSSGLSKSTTDNVATLLVNWERVRNLFNMLGIELTEEDFKTYLLTGLSKIFG
jgi:uncharacterized C2H2 Zn-finger protein